MNAEVMDRLELNLRSRLKPYRPNQDFVDHLKDKLINPAVVEMEYPLSRKSTFLKIAAGFALVTIGIIVIRKFSAR